jgi:hypothetical protein
MKVVITTDIALEPVTLEEVKEALKVTGTGHDDELERLITDARMYVERAIDTSVSERTLQVTSDVELEEYELPFGPVSDLVETEDADYNYVYTYTGGEETCPADIKRLITKVIKHWYDIDDEARALPESIKRQIQLRTRQPLAL